MDSESETKVGRRIEAALHAIRHAHFRLGMSGRWHIGKARDIVADHSLMERLVDPLDEQTEARYLNGFPALIAAIESQDAMCADLWSEISPDSETEYTTEHDHLCDLFRQLQFTLKSYERTVRQPQKPLLTHAKELVRESSGHPAVKELEQRLRLRLNDFIQLETEIDENLAKLDAARNELADAHRDFAIQCAADSGQSDETTVACALYGVEKAAEYFDYTRGYRFTTYARHWIEKAIELRRSQ